MSVAKTQIQKHMDVSNCPQTPNRIILNQPNVQPPNAPTKRCRCQDERNRSFFWQNKDSKDEVLVSVKKFLDFEDIEEKKEVPVVDETKENPNMESICSAPPSQLTSVQKKEELPIFFVNDNDDVIQYPANPIDPLYFEHMMIP